MEETPDPIANDEFIGPEIQEHLSKEEEYEAQKEFAKHRVRAKDAVERKPVKKKKKIKQQQQPVESSKEPACHKSKLKSGDHSFGGQMRSRRGYMMRYCRYCNTIEFYTSIDKNPVSRIPKAIVDEYEKTKAQ